MEQLTLIQYLLSAFIGIGLAAASGFRIFMPLFAVSLASYLGWIPMGDEWQWLGSLPTLLASGIAMIIEVLAYYIPFVDNLLDSINVPLAMIAGTVLFASQFTEMGAFAQWALALIAGGGTAAVIKTGFAGARATSTATTAGVANAGVSSVENMGGVSLSFLALALPIVAFIITLLLLFFIIKYGRKLIRKLKSRRQGPKEEEL